MEFNKHIDFLSIFKELMETHEELMEPYKYEADHYIPILEFYRAGLHKEYDMDLDECEFADEYIWFYFFKEYNDANESDTQNSYSSHLIKFDRVLEEFTEYEYEQG